MTFFRRFVPLLALLLPALALGSAVQACTSSGLLATPKQQRDGSTSDGDDDLDEVGCSDYGYGYGGGCGDNDNDNDNGYGYGYGY